METLLENDREQYFPCPICGEGLEVRTSKKGKPYVVCYACGMQMFVRTVPGIQRLEELAKAAESRNIWQRLAELEERFKKKCPKCARSFWIEERLIETSDLDGSFQGFRCPQASCGAIVKSERKA
jgi:predicted RNA-binding Zn-ribbon protein involved in translation (DUF1610 family)